MKPIRIPSRIDEPPHILLWSADELVPMLLGLTAGILLGHAMILLLVGLAVTSLYRRFRDNNPDGYLLHLIYWSGFLPSQSKLMQNPYIKRYYP